MHVFDNAWLDLGTPRLRRIDFPMHKDKPCAQGGLVTFRCKPDSRVQLLPGETRVTGSHARQEHEHTGSPPHLAW